MILPAILKKGRLGGEVSVVGVVRGREKKGVEQRTGRSVISDYGSGMSVEERLNELGIELPEVATPVASYVNVVRTGNLLFLSGGLPDLSREECKGQVPSGVTPELAKEAAREAILGRLAVIRNEIGSLDKVTRVVSVQGFVRAAQDFGEIPQVINGASDTLVEVFGPEIGSHSRTAVGVASLPLNVCVEVALVVEVC